MPVAVFRKLQRFAAGARLMSAPLRFCHRIFHRTGCCPQHPELARVVGAIDQDAANAGVKLFRREPPVLLRGPPVLLRRIRTPKI